MFLFHTKEMVVMGNILEKLHLGQSPLTQRVYVGTFSVKMPGTWNSKRDVTDEFINIVIERWKGTKQQFTFPAEGKTYEISVREVPAPEAK
jgi:hypothetical protein